MRSALLLFAAMLPFTLPAQQPAAPAPPGTVANPNGTLTFRLKAPAAQSVSVESDALAKPAPMQKDASGVWSYTSPPLKPEFYGYSFHIDNAPATLDPQNRDVRPNIVSLTSSILLPGHPAEPWERTAIPHGALTRSTYTTRIAQNLPENQESYVVYTPPGYDPHRAEPYPVLYLLHGWSDSEVGWTAVGKANDILDTLLAQGKIVPMVVVMPMGYGDYHFVTSGFDVWQNPTRVDDNTSIFMDMLTSEVMPAVEGQYNIAKDRDHRAVAGLSMGGLEALSLGMIHHELFSYVVGMSAAVHGEHFDQHFPALAAGAKNSGIQFRLLWVGCGTEDGLIRPNRDFVAWAKGKGLPVTAVETPGQHTWLVWRQNLLAVAPLLFR